MGRLSVMITAALELLLAAACAHTVYPVTTGSHALPEPNFIRAKSVVVWSNDSGVGNTLISGFQRAGLVVVERARLQQLLKEQQIRLTNTSGDDPDILRVGKLIGADRVVFVEVKSTEALTSSATINKYGGRSSSGVIYHLSVAVRSVDVKTGTIRWAGTAFYPSAINNPEQGLSALTMAAVARAICPVEAGYVWVELSAGSDETSGCTKNGVRVKLSDMKEDLVFTW